MRNAREEPLNAHLRRRSVIVLPATAVLLAVGGGIAYANVPDSGGVSTAAGTRNRGCCA